MGDNEKRFVEELLDASLRHYANAKPHPGMEDRVLAGVRAQLHTARRRTAWTWAVGIAGEAVKFLTIFLTSIFTSFMLAPWDTFPKCK